MSFLSIWERIQESTDIQSFVQLSKVVGTTQPYVSRKAKRDEFPIEWAYKVAKRYGLLTEWLLSGEGPRSLQELNGQKDFDFPILLEINEWLKNVTVQEPQRAEWFTVSFQDAFPMFREWKKRRDKQEGRGDTDPQSNVA